MGETGSSALNWLRAVRKTRSAEPGSGENKNGKGGKARKGKGGKSRKGKGGNAGKTRNGKRKIKVQVKGMGKRKVKVQEKRKVKICKHLLTTSFGALIYHWSKFWRNVLRKRSKTENIFYEIGYLDYGTIILVFKFCKSQ